MRAGISRETAASCDWMEELYVELIDVGSGDPTQPDSVIKSTKIKTGTYHFFMVERRGWVQMLKFEKQAMLMLDVGFGRMLV